MSKKIIEECLVKQKNLVYENEIDVEATKRSGYNTYHHWVLKNTSFSYHKAHVIEIKNWFGNIRTKIVTVGEIEESQFNKLKESGIGVYLITKKD